MTADRAEICMAMLMRLAAPPGRGGPDAGEVVKEIISHNHPLMSPAHLCSLADEIEQLLRVLPISVPARERAAYRWKVAIFKGALDALKPLASRLELKAGEDHRVSRRCSAQPTSRILTRVPARFASDPP